MHTAYRSVLGQINWLQSRTQFHIGYQFSRCASKASSPTIEDVRAINKTVRTIKSIPLSMRFWPLRGKTRIVGYPDASYRNNEDKLVTTASTTHQPEQKETMRLIQMLRKESNSGQMHDLAHVRSEDCLADSLTKHSAKADELIKDVLTGNLLNVDAHPPFRIMLQNKAFLVEWLAHNTKQRTDPTWLPLQESV